MTQSVRFFGRLCPLALSAVLTLFPASSIAGVLGGAVVSAALLPHAVLACYAHLQLPSILSGTVCAIDLCLIGIGWFLPF